MDVGEAMEILQERMIATYQNDILASIRQPEAASSQWRQQVNDAFSFNILDALQTTHALDHTWRLAYGMAEETDDWQMDEYPDGRRYVHNHIKDKK